MWLGVAPQWISKKHVFKTKLKYMLKYDSYSKLNSQHNLKGRRGGVWPFKEYENLHDDIKLDIHTSSKNYGESGYGLDLDLLTISC